MNVSTNLTASKMCFPSFCHRRPLLLITLGLPLEARPGFTTIIFTFLEWRRRNYDKESHGVSSGNYNPKDMRPCPASVVTLLGYRYKMTSKQRINEQSHTILTC